MGYFPIKCGIRLYTNSSVKKIGKRGLRCLQWRKIEIKRFLVPPHKFGGKIKMKTIYMRATPEIFHWGIALADQDESVYGKIGSVTSALETESREGSTLESCVSEMVSKLKQHFGSLSGFEFEYGFDSKSCGKTEAELDVLKHGPKYKTEVKDLLTKYSG